MPVSSRHNDCRKKGERNKRIEKKRNYESSSSKKEKLDISEITFFFFPFYRNVNVKKCKIFVVISNIFSLLFF